MKSRRVSIRMGERMMLQLEEFSRLTGVGFSAGVKMMIRRSIDELTDINGEWMLDNVAGSEAEREDR